MCGLRRWLSLIWRLVVRVSQMGVSLPDSSSSRSFLSEVSFCFLMKARSALEALRVWSGSTVVRAASCDRKVISLEAPIVLVSDSRRIALSGCRAGSLDRDDYND